MYKLSDGGMYIQELLTQYFYMYLSNDFPELSNPVVYKIFFYNKLYILYHLRGIL